MKIRTGFVSNSSSQHSITFSSKFFVNDLLKPTDLIDDKFKYIFKYKLVEDDFGWDFNSYYEVETKLNYIMLELMYKYNDINKILQSDEYIKLKNIIKKYCDIEFCLDDNINESIDCYGYIDHQSVGTIYDNDIFENNNLEHFLFDINSSIDTGNDNV